MSLFDTINDLKTMQAICRVPQLPYKLLQQAQERAKLLRMREGARRRFWNSTRAIQAELTRQVNYRFECGYTENEAARGIDEQESYEWEEMRNRIRFLRRRALRKIRRGNHGQV